MDHEDAEAVVLVEDRAPQPILSIRGTVRVDQLAERQAESLRELSDALRTRGIAPVGPPLVRYHTFGETETDVEVGVPVADPVAGDGPVAPGELPGGPAITTWHLGSHDRLGEAYARLQSWMSEHDRTPAAAGWEIYHWIDPAADPDPASWPPPEEWRAELVQPLARADE